MRWQLLAQCDNIGIVLSVLWNCLIARREMDVSDVETLLVVAQLYELIHAPARAMRCYTDALALRSSDIDIWLRLVRRTLSLNIRCILQFDRSAAGDLLMYFLRSTRYRYKDIDRSEAIVRFYDALAK